MNKKKMIIVLFLILLTIFVVCAIIYTYATFTSEFSGDMKVDNATWKIVVNNTDISSPTVKSFTIDALNVDESQGVEPGKLAPGLNGNFNILIDPSDTDVSIKFDIKLDTQYIDDANIEIVSVIETNNNKELINTDKNEYTGTILLDDIKKGTTDNIQVNVKWEDNDLNDIEIGKKPNNQIKIPVEIKVSQYLGETIEEYDG